MYLLSEMCPTPKAQKRTSKKGRKEGRKEERVMGVPEKPF